jgi:HEAT repeat protein
MAAARSLGRMGPGAPTTALATALTDESPFVREAAALAFADLGRGHTDTDGLLAASRDEIASVRAAAARALTLGGDPRAQARLSEMAQDPDATVRAAAASKP